MIESSVTRADSLKFIIWKYATELLKVVIHILVGCLRQIPYEDSQAYLMLGFWLVDLIVYGQVTSINVLSCGDLIFIWLIHFLLNFIREVDSHFLPGRKSWFSGMEK